MEHPPPSEKRGSRCGFSLRGGKGGLVFIASCTDRCPIRTVCVDRVSPPRYSTVHICAQLPIGIAFGRSRRVRACIGMVRSP